MKKIFEEIRAIFETHFDIETSDITKNDLTLELMINGTNLEFLNDYGASSEVLREAKGVYLKAMADTIIGLEKEYGYTENVRNFYGYLNNNLDSAISFEGIHELERRFQAALDDFKDSILKSDDPPALFNDNATYFMIGFGYKENEQIIYLDIANWNKGKNIETNERKLPAGSDIFVEFDHLIRDVFPKLPEKQLCEMKL